MAIRGVEKLWAGLCRPVYVGACRPYTSDSRRDPSLDLRRAVCDRDEYNPGAALARPVGVPGAVRMERHATSPPSLGGDVPAPGDIKELAVSMPSIVTSCMDTAFDV